MEQQLSGLYRGVTGEVRPARLDRKVAATDIMFATENGDYSQSFAPLRPLLVNSKGVRYADFIKTLSPRFAKLYRDIALGYMALGLAFAGMVELKPAGLVAGAVSAGVAAIWFGFWIAYLQLFIHEGAHFNFSRDRLRSDMLCNLLISWMIGTSVQRYRAVHFQHHRELGNVNDSEMTYFFPLNLVFVLKGLFGIRALEVLAGRRAIRPSSDAHRTDGKYVGLLGITAHLLIVVAAYAFGSIWLCLAWIAGLGAVFPFLGALRQLLEHRDTEADASMNYFKTPHGAYTRMFGSGVFPSLFGGAGFNRHLLHHWEPALSYTNLDEFESFLLDTDAARLIEMRRSSYFKTFVSLFGR